MSKNLISSLILIGMIAAPAAVNAEADPPEISLEGLELVEKTRRGELYADPEIDWSVYDQIQLESASVAFRKNWQRDQNRYQPQRSGHRTWSESRPACLSCLTAFSPRNSARAAMKSPKAVVKA